MGYAIHLRARRFVFFVAFNLIITTACPIKRRIPARRLTVGDDIERTLATASLVNTVFASSMILLIAVLVEIGMTLTLGRLSRLPLPMYPIELAVAESPQKSNLFLDKLLILQIHR
ncbi:MAG: hypothetical protein JOS17DRAFT_812925 [Linnemannia elongata]|nr:MAG: hypothetical protein JOS17DRAFT_812925 [Linnemannia elongata]